jgi:hypothetical protein
MTNWKDPAERLAYAEINGWAEMKYARNKYQDQAPKGVAAIDADDIARASYTTDIDVAIRNLQEIAGIDDGGIAGICFADFDWINASPVDRLDAIYAWIKTERRFDAI